MCQALDGWKIVAGGMFILKPDTCDVDGFSGWYFGERARGLLHSSKLWEDAEDIPCLTTNDVVFHLDVVLDEFDIGLVEELD